MDEDVLRLEWSYFQFQRLGFDGKIPRVVHDCLRPSFGLFIGLV